MFCELGYKYLIEKIQNIPNEEALASQILRNANNCQTVLDLFDISQILNAAVHSYTWLGLIHHSARPHPSLGKVSSTTWLGLIHT